MGNLGHDITFRLLLWSGIITLLGWTVAPKQNSRKFTCVTHITDISSFLFFLHTGSEKQVNFSVLSKSGRQSRVSLTWPTWPLANEGIFMLFTWPPRGEVPPQMRLSEGNVGPPTRRPYFKSKQACAPQDTIYPQTWFFLISRSHLAPPGVYPRKEEKHAGLCAEQTSFQQKVWAPCCWAEWINESRQKRLRLTIPLTQHYATDLYSFKDSMPTRVSAAVRGCCCL